MSSTDVSVCVIVLFSLVNHNVISFHFFSFLISFHLLVWQQSMFQFIVLFVFTSFSFWFFFFCIFLWVARIIGFEMKCVVFLTHIRARANHNVYRCDNQLRLANERIKAIQLTSVINSWKLLRSLRYQKWWTERERERKGEKIVAWLNTK